MKKDRAMNLEINCIVFCARRLRKTILGVCLKESFLLLLYLSDKFQWTNLVCQMATTDVSSPDANKMVIT